MPLHFKVKSSKLINCDRNIDMWGVPLRAQRKKYQDPAKIVKMSWQLKFWQVNLVVHMKTIFKFTWKQFSSLNFPLKWNILYRKHWKETEILLPNVCWKCLAVYPVFNLFIFPRWTFLADELRRLYGKYAKLLSNLLLDHFCVKGNQLKRHWSSVKVTFHEIIHVNNFAYVVSLHVLSYTALPS